MVLRSSLGSPTAPTLDFCMKASDMVAGASGLSIILRSDTPSGRKRSSQRSAVEDKTDADPPLESADVSGGVEVEAGEAAVLPPAPSDYHTYIDAGRVRSLLVADFAKLLRLGMSVEHRFPQPVTFRTNDGPHFQGIGIQPAEKAVWQRMRLLQEWELSDIDVPKRAVELGSGSAAQARQGRIEFKLRGYLQNKIARNQRGTDIFTKLFKDVTSAAKALSAEDGVKHPILFCDFTSWGGDSASALLDWAIAEERAQREADEHEGCQAGCLFGLFFDKKDVHYQITKARREDSWRRAVKAGNLTLDKSVADVAPPAELVSLRAKVSVAAVRDSLSVLKIAQGRGNGGRPALVIPDPVALKFEVSDSLKRRLEELQAEFAPTPETRLKRQRLDPPRACVANLPDGVSAAELRNTMVVIESQQHCVAGKAITVLKTRLASAVADDTTEVFFYAHNSGTVRLSLGALSHFCCASAGRFLDRIDGDFETVEGGPLVWPWRLGPVP